MQSVKVGVIGGAGYTGGELLRVLLGHPEVEFAYVNSESQRGKSVWEVHKDLFGSTDLKFSNEKVMGKADVLFLCSGHGQSAKFLEENNVPDTVKIIDLSTDFRDEGGGFVYGLPELKREAIRRASKIANPGCFATSIQLALLPLAKNALLKNDVHVSAITGSTGAGQSPSATGHFSWRNNNVSVYKAFTHQHLKEIGQSLGQLQPGFNHGLYFIPYRGNFARGIMANVYTEFEGSAEEAQKLYRDYYAGHPFTFVMDQTVDLKMVVNTNKCIVQVQKQGKHILITSIIDNLLKGASGQAVQNMNLIFGLEETTGLWLKPVGF